MMQTQQKYRLAYRIIIIWAICTLFISSTLFGQVCSGAAFLKMLPGAKLHSMAGSYTAVISDMHAIYANPGFAGFLREWQWSATYTKWIADVYNASIIYGRRLPMPWSRDTSIGLGVLYQGMPDFDSSYRTAPSASASDLILSGSIGQPLNFISNYISIGTNLKYYRSKLAQYEAQTLALDFGMLYRTPRFRLMSSGKGPFRYGIFSTGIALTNYGGELKYKTVGTPLPEALRAGIAFNAGAHRRLHLQLTMDYQKRKDENGFWGFGAELNWRHMFAIHGGYDTSTDLLDKFTFGFSLYIDDINSPISTRVPGRNKGLGIDLATMNERDFFHHTYRGGVTHQPIGPEKFDFTAPDIGHKLLADSVRLIWRPSKDPDLYDFIRYAVLVDQDSLKLAQKIHKVDQDIFQFLGTPADSSIFYVRKDMRDNQIRLDKLIGGDYYWAVVAYDSDLHLRFAEKDGRRIAHFRIPYADLLVKSITFDHSPWLTIDDYHGQLKVSIANEGERVHRNISLIVFDSTVVAAEANPEPEYPYRRVLQQYNISVILPGEEKTLELPWRTPDLGLHDVSGFIDAENAVNENVEINNLYRQSFYTIPKGSVAAKDTATAISFAKRSFDLPIITEICFDTSSTVVKPEYLVQRVLKPTLKILSNRLVEHRDLSVTLQGFADPNAGEFDVSLADARARAVRDTMINLRVRVDQVKLLPGQLLKKRYVPAKPEDARWVFEERRYVQITADVQDQGILFKPITYIDIEHMGLPVTFLCIIKGIVPIENGLIILDNGYLRDSLKVTENFVNADLSDEVDWFIENSLLPDQSLWLDRSSEYYVLIRDSLGRQFKSHPQYVFLVGKELFHEHTIAFPLKFDDTNPLYTFYWANVMHFAQKVINEPDQRFCFRGHACAIGRASYNLRLSRDRATTFHRGFLKYARNNYMDIYNPALSHLDAAEGFGENEPLAVRRSSGKLIRIGDNNIPTGRKLNRRIEIYFYSLKNPLHQNKKAR